MVLKTLGCTELTEPYYPRNRLIAIRFVLNPLEVYT